jgi:signal transduction histidine kinase
MEDLAHRMLDFLNNKYSYQFTVPAPDEVGRLHATFNSMAQKVLQQIEDLKSLDKAKTEFLSIASHELRTPLTSIKGSLSLLNSGVAGGVSDTAKNLMTIALSETDRLIRIINELLDLAKIEARQFPLNCQWVWAHDLIEKTLAGLTGFCQEAQVSLEHNDCKNIDLWADQDRLHQVLTNLLSNAVKFSPNGSTVRVQFLIDENSHLRIEITDQGRGIAPEDQELIFEKFRQATSAQNPLVKGTGLGLTIAKALVEQHGGQIGVRSTPGQGATFYFTIPKWQNHSATDKQATPGAA